MSTVRSTLLALLGVACAGAPGLAHGSPPQVAQKTSARIVKPLAKPAPVAAPLPASRIWHAVPPGKTAAVDAAGRPLLVLQALNTTDRATLTSTLTTAAEKAITRAS